MSTPGYDSTATFQIVVDDAAVAQSSEVYDPLAGFGVWTGSGAYVAGETVDIHFSLPEAAEVRITIVKE